MSGFLEVAKSRPVAIGASAATGSAQRSQGLQSTARAHGVLAFFLIACTGQCVKNLLDHPLFALIKHNAISSVNQGVLVGTTDADFLKFEASFCRF